LILSSYALEENDFSQNKSVFIWDGKNVDTKTNQAIYHLPAMIFFQDYNEETN
jgi:hypothetical protein